MSKVRVDRIEDLNGDFGFDVPELGKSVETYSRALKPSATAPTRRDNGAALQVGDSYPNTVDENIYLWNGTSWISSTQKLIKGLATPAGSDGVGFIQTYLGSISRTSLNKMRDRINIKDFGAQGNGYQPVSEWYTPGFSSYRGYANLAALQVDYPHVTSATDSTDWAAIQAADNAAASIGSSTEWSPGNYVTNKTLLLKANVVGLGKSGAWSADSRGVILTNYGVGDGKRWTDIDGNDTTNFTPIVVIGRSGVTISGITVKDSGARWSCGIFLPSIRRTSIVNTDVMGQFKESGVYLDATWSNVNTTLTSLHPTVESDSGMNEFIFDGGFVTGLMGIKCQGTTRPVSTLPWVWAPGGTSDLNFLNFRFGSDGPADEKLARGGAFYHDATIPNSAEAGQGINFVNGSFRVSARYGLKLDHSNRVTFVNCYGETISSWTAAGNPRAVFAFTSNTGAVTMSNDAVGFGQEKDGVLLPSGSLLEWQLNRGIAKFRADGFFATPNIFANASSSTGLLFTSFANGGVVMLRSDNGTTATPYMLFSDTVMRPLVAAGISIGTTGFPYETGNIRGVRVTTELRPTVPNTVTNGTSTFPWAGGFTQTAFTVTSDERLKDFTDDLTDEFLDIWATIDWRSWKFKDRMVAKGEDLARVHFGLGAQTVIEAYAERGIDIMQFALICFDEWPDLFENVDAVYETTPEELDENGVVIKEAVEVLVSPAETHVIQKAGDQYGIRYEEALCLEAALTRRTLARQADLIQKLTKRIEALEKAV
jgi:hypothetical protein